MPSSFDWNHARTFLAVAVEGSLSAAACKLGQTQPTVSRQVAALEQALGVTLFERTGRAAVLTEAGVDLLDHVRAMAQGADLLALAASGQSQSIDGQVWITASEMMSAHGLPELLKPLIARAPLLRIDLVADNDLRDLSRREADIAIRHARPEQPDLTARRVAYDVMRFRATPAYVAAHGDPRVGDLSDQQLVSFVGA